MAYTEFAHEPSEMEFTFGTTGVLLGEFFPTSSPLDKPMRLVGNKLVPAAMKQGWSKYVIPSKLQLPWPNLATGFEVVEQPHKLVDTRNRIRMLKELRDAAQFSTAEAAKDLGELGKFLKSNQSKLDAGDEKASQEFTKHVRDLTRKHESLGMVLDASVQPSTLLKEKADVIDVLAGLGTASQPLQVVEAADKKLAAIEKEIQAQGADLKADFEPYLEAIAGLSLFATNGGTKAPVYLINCRDVNEVLSLHRDKLIRSIAGLKNAPHVDVGILNRVSGGSENLKKLGQEMDKSVRSSIWATLGGVVNEEYAIKLAENNPTVATEGAGAVFVHLGMARHRGYQAVVSAAVLGKRIELDQRFNEKEAGPMTHHFGPQSNKNLEGLDEPLETFEWEFDTLKMLAREAGLNVVTRHANGVVSPYLGRTLSSLTDYRFIDSSRLTNLLSGFVMAYLDVSAPGMHNTPRLRRAFCEQAEDKFFTPFKSRDGFEGALTPLDSSKGVRFDLSLAVKVADPIEEIFVTRRQMIKKKD